MAEVILVAAAVATALAITLAARALWVQLHQEPTPSPQTHSMADAIEVGMAADVDEINWDAWEGVLWYDGDRVADHVMEDWA